MAQLALKKKVELGRMKEMNISLTIPIENTVTNHGYGVAAQSIVQSLQALGHSVPFQSPDAPVEIAFCQPYLWEWSNPEAYHIGYVPWESTVLPEDWLEPMHAVDEIWTTSPWCKTVFEKNGFSNVRVFEHGVDTNLWTRKRRRLKDGRAVRFLHMGEPAPRKGGQMVYDTFKELFGNSDKASLTIKAHGMNTIRGKNSTRPDKELTNVTVYTEELAAYELIDLVRRHDVLLYPSYGEGFGLIPLQAMATGMPVVCTANWAPYRDLLLPDLALPSKLISTPWPEIHPGNMYEPDRNALRSAMDILSDPYEFQSASARAYFNSFRVEGLYDWTRLTRDAFAHIAAKFD